MPAEVVEISTPPGQMGPGPSDNTMYVINPVKKGREYGMHKDDHGNPYVYLPPWNGPVHEPATPDAEGNFLHYENINDPRFHAAHTYAAIRYTLDVWEQYYGRPIEWYFKNYYPKAEVVILPEFENAQIGRGFIEIGTDVNKIDGTLSPFPLNFDVIAHEVGHGILFSEVGEPDADKETGEFLGFQESSGDVVSMIAILHFDSVIDEILESTSGNLYMANHLNRFAETSAVAQIRMASNNYKLSDFSDGWKDSHLLAQPLTGAIFDIFVDIFHEELVRLGAISTNLEQLSDLLEGTPEYEARLHGEFEAAYEMHASLFKEALLYSRDALATLLIETWSRLSPNYLRYTNFHQAMQRAEQALFNGLYRNIIDVNFKWRNIGTAIVGPQLPKEKGEDHSHSHGKAHNHSETAETATKPSTAVGRNSAEGSYRMRSHKSQPYARRYRESRGMEP
ncbi:hypothetical protein AB833_04405 [Chromatiales bacterium (ex Bugula neritina AB1)]|nr:hypothetical protein AB833_04405 [Chromatiales bacterium (ex Bugula neritina AB1)]